MSRIFPNTVHGDGRKIGLMRPEMATTAETTVHTSRKTRIETPLRRNVARRLTISPARPCSTTSGIEMSTCGFPKSLSQPPL